MPRMIKAWHHYEKWECIKAGMYSSLPTAIPIDTGRAMYAKFFNDGKFAAAIDRIFNEWPISCEQFLTDTSTPFNRVAWLGQAACCISEGLPRLCRGGYRLLDIKVQDEADGLAQERIKDFEVWYIRKSSRIHREVEKERLLGRYSGGSAGSVDEREFSSIVQGYLPGFTFE